MRRAVLLLALALPACTGAATRPAVTPAPAPAPALIAQRASAAIDTLVRVNALAQRAVALVLPFLPPERARLVELAAARVEETIALVSEARDLAELAMAVAAAREAITDYKRVAGA